MKTPIKNNEKWSDLERFTKKGARIGKAFITISKRGTLTLSSGFIHNAKIQLCKKTHVLLSYSRSQKAIVINFTDDETEAGAIKMTLRTNALLAVRSFLNYHHLDFSNIAGKYLPKLETIPKSGSCWIIYLNQKEVE